MAQFLLFLFLLKPYALLKKVPPQYRESLEDVLEEAGENKEEIISAILSLEKKEELEVALFIISQLPYRFTWTISGNELERVSDARTIKKELILSHVRHSLRAREKYPWTRLLDFDDFLRYVAAYRGTTEKLEDWRDFFLSKKELVKLVDDYARKYEKAIPREKSKIYKELIYSLNSRWLALQVKYSPRGFPDLSPTELFEKKKGRCTDLTNALLSLLRTFGIPSTGVRCIWWPKSNSNHYWAAVLDPLRGEWYDIDAAMGGKSEGYYRVYRFDLKKPIAKVYRIIPGRERDRLREFLRVRRGIFPWYIDLYLISVPSVDFTEEYTWTKDVSFKDLPPRNVVFLSVFNNGLWLEVAATLVDEDGVAIFKNLGCDNILYLLTSWDERGQQYLRPPFVLRRDGTVQFFSTKRKNAKKFAVSIDVENLGLKEGKYILKYWNGEEWEDEREYHITNQNILEDTLRAKILYSFWDSDGNSTRPFAVWDGIHPSLETF